MRGPSQRAARREAPHTAGLVRSGAWTRA